MQVAEVKGDCLVIRAIRLLGGKPPEIDFVATEQEAHAWLARKRKQAPR